MRIARKFGVLAVAVSSLALLSACGGPPPAAKVAQVQPAELPPGASWNGVYFNELYGNLHLVHTGSTIQGKWKRTDGSAWGEMHGSVTGNLFRFEWAEYKDGFVGAAGTSRGKGFFVYKRPDGENVDDRLEGEWGFGDDEIGNPWQCVKQRNKEPDLKSIGSTVDATGPVGDWE